MSGDALEMLRASYCPTCKTAEACSEETPCAKWAATIELRRLRAVEAAARNMVQSWLNEAAPEREERATFEALCAALDAKVQP